MTPRRFRDLVRAHYLEHGRHDLPWRKTTDPYRILVSEVMLQQTQVARATPYYRAFLKRFPTARSLAAASLGDVLSAWQGLGYNRRAKMLHEAAKAVVLAHGGQIPVAVEALEALPGVGHYTARAVAAFAGNQDVVFVETNLRTAVIHHFFPGDAIVSDAEVLAVLQKALLKAREVTDAREWYSALMDYGAFLKQSGVRVNARSTGYAKQAAFAGSGREARGAILKALTQGAKKEAPLLTLLGPERAGQLSAQLAALAKEGLIERSRGAYRLPE